MGRASNRGRRPRALATRDRRMPDCRQDARAAATPAYPGNHPVMLVWGVASEALREIITGFLDEVRFD